MDDLISREEAINAVKKNTFRLTFAEEQNCEGHVAWSANAVYSDVMEGALLELPSAQPENNCSEIPNNSDLIRRETARRIIASPRSKEQMLMVLASLPSEQPEIIHCENCEHWKNNHLCECLSRYGTFDTPKDFFCGYGKANQ